jgi:hypothetical protein
LNEFLSTDVGALVQQRVNRPRGLALGPYRIHADEVITDPAEPTRVTLSRVAFVEADQRQWVRFGTAHRVTLEIEQQDRAVRVSGSMNGMSLYDRRDSRFADVDEQSFPLVELPTLLPAEIKFLTLGELLTYLKDVGSWAGVRDALAQLRMLVAGQLTYENLLARWRPGEPLEVGPANLRYLIRSETAACVPHGGLEFTNATVDEYRNDHRRRVSADRVELEVIPGRRLADLALRLELRTREPESSSGSMRREFLGPVPVAAEAYAALITVSDADLPRFAERFGSEESVRRQNERVAKERGHAVRRMAATIHERAAFSISVLVLVLLGAVLGVILRGAHVVTAFGIGFVPMILVMLAIMAGKQMAHNASTHVAGLVVMWGGIAVVAMVDCWAVFRLLRR